MSDRLAACDAAGFWTPGALEPLPWQRTPQNIGGLFHALERLGAEALHVHRSALPVLGLPERAEVPARGQKRPPHPFVVAGGLAGKRPSTSALAPSIECGGLEVLIGAYQDGAGDPFEDASDGRELLEAVRAFADAFVSRENPEGFRYANSAIVTARNLMDKPWRHGRRIHNLRELGGIDPEQPPELAGEQVEVPWGAWAAPAVHGKGLAYVHAYDVNAQRLAACGRLSLGVGGMRRFDDPGELVAPINLRLPGYHFVSAVEAPFGQRIPPIFEPGWHTTPRVAMAGHLGVHVTIERSIVWERHLAYLDPFYVAMRDAREQLLARPFGELALPALKLGYLGALGRLRSARGSGIYRPDWYDAVIGQELARQYLRLHRLAELGVPVLAVYFDAVAIESDDPDPASAAAPVLEVSSQLGKFKVVGSMPAGRARKILYGGTGARRVNELMRALRAAPSWSAAQRAGTPQSPSIQASLYRPVHGGYAPVCRR